MGLIKMVTGAVGSTFRDAAKDYFRCDNMTNDVLVMPATQVKRDGSCNNASDRIISDGSVFDVAVGQAALLIENGKVVEFVLASDNTFAGQYTYKSTVEPSFLATEGFKKALKTGIDTAINRFKFGGQSSNTMNIVYLNLKEIMDNKIGFGKTAFIDKYLGTRLMLSGNGTYSFRISDPMKFFENVVTDYNRKYMKADLVGTMKTEIVPVLKRGLTTLGNQYCQNGYQDIYMYDQELADIVNKSMDDSWNRRGIELVSIAISPVLSPEDEERVMQLENAKTLSNPNMAMGSMINAQNSAMQTAAGNSAGAMHGFMNMNMFGGGQGGFNMGQMVQQQLANQPAPAPAPTPAAPAANSWTCSCGTTNTGNFCQGCGSKKPAPAGSWTCSCGTTNTGNFCQGCGSKKPEEQAAPAKKFCSNCGKEIEVGDVPVKFCPGCGNKLD